ncbi:hypothetical protein LR24_03155 [Lacticaseibacillus rhamnosus]|uniref:restriction endonuclease subunit S n=2 Tax=Lacticaseibacillus rhamnosus TaxID=47715 RepID=UPI000501B793|nr:restriction endonuclease subunit S [Lacticaseibacillus rhamnosus]KFK47056.1 hypothetical protein LR24_03155 [Lacticaseibacillus rhamnosus]
MSKDTRNVPALRFKGFSDAWEKRKLGELSNIRRGASPRPISSKKWFSETSSIGWLRISDVTEQNGRIYHVAQHLSKEGQEKTLVLTTKHLILSIAATVGKPVQNYIALGIHDGFIVFLNPKFDLDFMFYFLEDYQPKWSRFGQPGSQVNINSELVRELEINVPREDEQKKISHVLLNVDNLIAATQDKLDHFEEIKKALLKHLFDQSMRFKGYSDPWEKRKLIYFLNVSDQKNSKGTFSKKDVLSVSGEFGIVNQIQFQGRSFAGVSVKKYGIVEKGDIVYTKSPLKRNPFGIIKVNRGQAGIVSTLYAIYKPRKTVCPSIIDYYFQSDTKLNNYLRPLVNKGAKNDMKVKNIDVLKGLVILPLNLDEQKKDIFFLDNITNLIAATQSKLSSLESLKKALLQGLFI